MTSNRRGRPFKSTQTCDVCKLRHQKCDSSRPSCQYCVLRDLECVYSRTPAHRITGSSVRKKGQRPQLGLTQSVDEKARWLDATQRPGTTRSREGDLVLPSWSPSSHPSQLFQLTSYEGAPLRPWIERPEPSRKANEEEFRAGDYSNPCPASPFQASLQYFVDVLSRTLLDGDKAKSAIYLDASSGCTNESDLTAQWGEDGGHAIYSFNRNALPPKAQLQSFLDAFLNGPNKMVFTCDPLDSQNQLDELCYQSRDISHASLSLILLQLSIGAQNLGLIPHQICSAFYESGRKAMEIGIEKARTNWLWTVQAHMLDCIYSMKAKPNTCWVVLGKSLWILVVNS